MSYDRLLKLMALTGSNNDNEALLAMREANKIANWPKIIGVSLDEHNDLIKKYNKLADEYNSLRQKAVLAMVEFAQETHKEKGFLERLLGL